MRTSVIAGLGLVLILLLKDEGMAQRMMRYTPDKPVVCHYTPKNRIDRVGVSNRFKTRHLAAGRTKTAVIEVEYIDFPPDNLAKTAFQYAIDIWKTELDSPIPIRIRAEWGNLSSGVLAQAIWGSAYANFGGEQHLNTFYPVALAEKISGRDLNGSDEPDIVATFNRNVPWYYGTDGLTPNGKMDLVTVVLHEVAHGLGFTDSYSVSGEEGSVGMVNGTAATPFVFDIFVRNGAGQNLLHDLPSPSPALGAALQRSDLYFHGPMSSVALAEGAPALFAPSPFDNGSSISHLDETVFNAPQDANRLMTPQIAAAESIHDPGSVLRAMFSDMGWVYTRIQHTPRKDTERKDGQPYLIAASIQSDNGYTPDSVKLHYTTDGTTFTTVNMTPTGTANQYQAFLPGTTSDLAYGYYLSVADVLDRRFTSPGKIQAPGNPPRQGTHFFRIGTDSEAPEIMHEPVTYVFETDSELTLAAEVTDNLGINEVLVEYRVNGGGLQTRVMDGETGTDRYRVSVPLTGLTRGDGIRYRLVARDLAGIENVSSLPADGFFDVYVTGVMPTKDAYTNDFNEGGTTDFFGNGFSIATPPGFENAAIHSDHPYLNGSGPGHESHYTYQLQVPVRINDSNPYIRFDEIVLVEPGAAQSVFGDRDFFDYVVVEGSADGGISWSAFAPGYDARGDAAWLSHYNADISEDNSKTTGDPALYRPRSIHMLESGVFSPGDEVLIRFRLFADQLAHGWGWAIDNLSIQSPVTDAGPDLVHTLDIYPVPAAQELFVSLSPGGLPTRIEIVDLQGRMLHAESFSGSNEDLVLRSIDVQSFESGVYILKAIVGNRSYRKKFFIR